MPLPEAGNAQPAEQEEVQVLNNNLPGVIDIANSSDDDSDMEDAIFRLVAAMEPNQRSPCISDAHQNPHRNRWPDARTVETCDWINGQIDAYERELSSVRQVLKTQRITKLDLEPNRNQWNPDSCSPSCQHMKAHREYRILDLMNHATKRMEKACNQYITALREIRDSLSARTYHQRHFRSPLLYGPLPIPDTFLPPPIEMSDDSTDSLNDPSDTNDNPNGASTNNAAE